ncbi:hypothetical protein LWI28_027097 [Acer negundo]|uniref:Reverse transcriptase Ty1/copia-type domain-containing protein n=1 Tax=Acer negundo TaxID=4023 RepID=A0AAD5IN80_ACENE|nr:hypothetical protein LWI28_027097 [Acer negundo]
MSESESTLHVKLRGNDEVLIVCLYVDDLIYTSNSTALIAEFKDFMIGEFEMTDIGLMNYFLGLEVKQSNTRIFISQEKYVNDLFEKFQMKDCNPVKFPMNTNQKFSLNDGEERIDGHLYRSLIGSMLYLKNCRPDIMFATSFLSRFMQNPSKLHYEAAKRMLRYFKGTSSYGIWYTNNVDNFQLCGYSDSDWAGSVDDRRSTTGYIFNLGSGAIAWNSKKQPSTALSSSEAEYMAATSASCQTVWLRRILEDMKQHQKVSTVVHCDNQSTIAMARNSIFHSRTRHVETRHHFIRELVDKGSIKMSYCSTDE